MIGLVSMAISSMFGAFAMGKDAHVWLEGKSTLHSYKLEAKKLSAQFSIGDDSADAFTTVSSGQVKALELRVAVAELRSGETGLDDNMKKALSADKHPEIVFMLSSAQVTPNGEALGVHLRGTLTISGKERPVELDARGVRDARGIRFTGEKTIRMSDWGVTPPVLMLGAIRTADDITLKFDFVCVKT